MSAARELFGEHGCYPLLAVGKLGEKSGFKLYADIAGIEPSIANDITSSIDRYNEDVKNADDYDKNSIEIADYIKDKFHLQIFEQSKAYQGIVEQAKVHACGHLIFNGDSNNTDVIGYGDIRYEFGLIRCHSESTGNSVLVVNAEGGLLDSMGYCKDDFLIVDVVTIIKKLYASIGMEVPSVAELRHMVENDDATWDLYANGITCCLNQCEKPGTTNKIQVYKPRNIRELAAFIAGIRPGFKSLIGGFINRVEYSNGEPAIDDLLKDSFHYCLFQESVMRIFSWLGIPMKDSYDTIKKISKKKLKGEALKHVEDTLRSHWLEQIGNLDHFDAVYQVVKDSAKYSFNAPHAGSMAYDSLYEGWFKAHHTSKFYEITMNHYQDKGDKDKVAELRKEAVSKMGYSTEHYKFGNDNRQIVVDDANKKIFPSLVTVKYMNRSIANSLYELGKRKFNTFIDVLSAIRNQKIMDTNQLSILIKLDYFSDFGNICQLLQVADVFYQIAKTSQTQFQKSKIDIWGIPENMVKHFSIGETQTTYKYDVSHYHDLLTCWSVWLGKNTKTSVSDKLKYQIDILGYVDYCDNNLDARYAVVTNLDTTYSPKFKAVCLKNGSICEMRISKRRNPKDRQITTSFADVCIDNGDVIYLTKCVKKPKQIKVGDHFETDPSGAFNWWATDYRLANEL